MSWLKHENKFINLRNISYFEIYTAGNQSLTVPVTVYLDISGDIYHVISLDEDDAMVFSKEFERLISNVIVTYRSHSIHALDVIIETSLINSGVKLCSQSKTPKSGSTGEKEELVPPTCQLSRKILNSLHPMSYGKENSD